VKTSNVERQYAAEKAFQRMGTKQLHCCEKTRTGLKLCYLTPNRYDAVLHVSHFRCLPTGVDVRKQHSRDFCKKVSP
jgi:hypothetical protein